MPTGVIFQLQLVCGYVAWLLWFARYGWPRLKTMEPVAAQRAIATLHGFRFFGLAFLVPGVVGPQLPASFATFAAYGDFATGVLAMLALMVALVRSLLRVLVLAYSMVGVADLLLDYEHAVRLGLPEMAGQLGAAYVIPVIYVPLLMITHLAALRLMFGRDAAIA